jgi:hypothetical protein
MLPGFLGRKIIPPICKKTSRPLLTLTKLDVYLSHANDTPPVATTTFKVRQMTTTQIEKTIAAAIARSESHNEIAKIEIDDDSNTALDAIRNLVECEIDHTDREDSNGRYMLDVWGFDEDAPAGEMLWRLAISFADPT